MASNTPFPINEQQTAIAIAYRNESYIADMVLPKIPPVQVEEFTWLKFKFDESFTIPDTRVGRKSRPNEVEMTVEEQTSRTQDYGLDDVIPQNDIDNASTQPGYDPVSRATEWLTDLIQLDREKRVSDLVFNLNTYPSGQRDTLSGSSQFSHADSDPIGVIMNALDAVVMRPNFMVIGRAAFSALVRNPKIVKAFHGNEGDSGVATRQLLADLFELSRGVAVGEAWSNTAKKGQTPSVTRLWGKHIALLHINPLADNQRGSSFGYTVPKGTMVAGQMPEPHAGLRGGVRVRVGESCKEIVAAPDFGYYLQNAAA
ncbi:phage capsid protein [Synechococcales cyanobacterium C]|uniref:Phage capsid protein n=1 Tax=Petrachloros mirabilis ULC683 TaxID=2781853 RepID=A0A8K2A788_9CYAN|nr:phage capsid protein [Petrachloros mirabilis]NCJ06679.1 phage capsid protein [Petrachloros mirabilis ULC683]